MDGPTPRGCLCVPSYPAPHPQHRMLCVVVCICLCKIVRMLGGGGHEATDTGLAYAPVSQAHGHHHIVQCFAALQRRPVMYHTRWLLTVHWLRPSEHRGQLAPTAHPHCRLVSNPCPAGRAPVMHLLAWVVGGGGAHMRMHASSVLVAMSVCAMQPPTHCDNLFFVFYLF